MVSISTAPYTDNYGLIDFDAVMTEFEISSCYWNRCDKYTRTFEIIHFIWRLSNDQDHLEIIEKNHSEITSWMPKERFLQLQGIETTVYEPNDGI